MTPDISKILVVHSQRNVLLSLKNELEKKGYHVFTASSGLEGLFIGYHEKFTMILTEVELPKVSGFEMVRTFINRKKNETAPVIFIGSGSESLEMRRIATSLQGIIMPLSQIIDSIRLVDNTTDTISEDQSFRLGTEAVQVHSSVVGKLSLN